MRRSLPLLLALLLAAAEPSAPIRIHLIGDSTMADKPNPEQNPERGWGQALAILLADRATVRNYAVNGRSTRSFLAEGRWDSVRTQLKRGDYVFIQFGHNDEKNEDSTRYAAPFTAYRRNLVQFVRDARTAGARPILFTPVVRRQFNANGVLEDTHGLYPLAVRDVARELAVPLVDLQTLTEDMVLRAGVEGSKALFVWTRSGENPAFPLAREDNTHFSPAGAREVAALVVEAIGTADRDLAAALQRVDRPLRTRDDRRSGTVVTRDDFGDQAASRVEELFVGRFPGVQVYSAPGGMLIRIRGAGTVLGGGDPLFLVDGMPFEPGTGGLVAINPRDVVRIEVLKDVAQTAEFGVRGANGVIKISTRRK